jgi:hypothetical protein
VTLWADRSGIASPERLRADVNLRDELEFCEKAGLPHSVFLGWDVDDQDLAIGYLRWKRECCPGCGAHPSEWVYEADGTIDEQDPPFDTAQSWCFGCQMTSEDRKAIPSERAQSVRVFLVPRKRNADKSNDELVAEAEEAELAEAAG